MRVTGRLHQADIANQAPSINLRAFAQKVWCGFIHVEQNRLMRDGASNAHIFAVAGLQCLVGVALARFGQFRWQSRPCCTWQARAVFGRAAVWNCTASIALDEGVAYLKWRCTLRPVAYGWRTLVKVLFAAGFFFACIGRLGERCCLAEARHNRAFGVFVCGLFVYSYCVATAATLETGRWRFAHAPCCAGRRGPAFLPLMRWQAATWAHGDNRSG